MDRRTFVLLALGGVGLAAGCQEAKVETAAMKPPYADVTLCGKCGQVKGSEKCCKPGAEKCPMCGLDKGSPGCCRINKLAATK